MPGWGYEYHIGFHERAMLLVRQSPQADEWLRRGATMGRHEVVEYALATLASDAQERETGSELAHTAVSPKDGATPVSAT
jgi:hypothetical protein